MSAIYQQIDSASPEIAAVLADQGRVFGVTVLGAAVEPVPGYAGYIYYSGVDTDDIVRHSPPGITGWVHVASGPDLTIDGWIADQQGYP